MRLPFTIAAVAALGLLVSSCGGRAAEERAGHERMIVLLQQLAEQSSRDNIYLGSARAEYLRREMATAGAQAPWRMRLDAGLAELQLGQERRSIEILTELREALQQGRVQGDYVAAISASFYLGVAWMRLAETENCCKSGIAESCILPFAEPAQHTAAEGSTNACHYLLEVLQNTPPTERWHLSARWLLNLAHMTLGTWPDGVPEQHRLPATTLESAAPMPGFVNIAGELGLDTDSNAGGVIFDDFDGDDWFDLVVSDWRPDAQIRYYHNVGDGTFVDRTEAAGLRGLTGGLNLMPADYDNDGDLDFLVLRGAWWREGGKHPNSLVRNNGDGTFTDVTFLAGLGGDYHPTQAAAWADYDRDGDLDFYVGNEYSEQSPSLSQLFRNNGDGTFTDVARAAGVLNGRYAKAVAWGDIDDDGDPDLYVSNDYGANRLYLNGGDGTFVDVAEERGVTGPEHGFPTWFFDYDNDGALDLFAANYSTDISHITAHLLDLDVPYGRPFLFHGSGDGKFRDVAGELGLTYPSLPMGANYGDFDNDGWLDLYLGTGDPNYHNLMPNVAYRNDGGRAFVDVTMVSGLGHLQKGHGIAFADFDRDGDQDVFAEMGGAYPGDRFRNVLFQNPGHGNHWLTLDLVGVQSSRTPIGARIRVVTTENGAERSIYKQVGSGGSFGASPLRQMVGLGRATSIVRVEILWPRTGATQTLTEVPLDRTLRVTEGKDGFTTLY